MNLNTNNYRLLFSLVCVNAIERESIENLFISLHCTLLEVKVVTQNKDKCLERDTCNRLKKKECENKDKCLGEGTCKSLKDKCENKRQVFRKM